MMPLVSVLYTQESIIDFTEVFHDLLFNIRGDKPQTEARKGKVMAFFLYKNIRI